MIIHIALYKFKPEIPQKDIDEALKEVRLLKETIPQIIEISDGENFSQYSKGYTHAIVSKFNSKADIEAYRSHPNHKPIADKLDQMEEDSIGMDFEV